MRNTKARGVRIIAFAAAVSALLAACGSGTPGQQAGGNAKAANGAVVVEMWQNKFGDADNAWFKAKTNAFNAAHKDIQVKLVLVPGDAWDQKMKSAQAAGKAPDLYTMNYSAVQAKARGGQLASLQDLIGADKWADLDARFLDDVSVDGKAYAYPFYFEPSSLLFYRTDLFTKAGLDPSAPPTSWDQLIRAGLALKAANPGIVPFQTAQSGVELSWTTWGLQMNAAGHLPISDDWTTARANDPAYLKLLNTYQTLAKDGILAKQPLSPYGDPTPLGEGKLAMMASGSWAISQLLLDYPKMIKNIAVAPLPSLDGDQTKATGTLGGWTLGVDAKSKQPKAAATVISWLLAEDPQTVLDYFKATNWTKFSPRKSVAAKMATADTSVNPWFAVMAKKVAPYQILEPTYDWTVSAAFGKALEEAMHGEDSAKALATAQAEITKTIADLKLGRKS